MEKAIGPAESLEWVGEAADAMRRTGAASGLEFDGVDVLDVLLSPMFLAVFGVSRESAGVGSGQSRFAAGLRRIAYVAKMTAVRKRTEGRSAGAARTDVLFWPRHITHIVDQQPVAAGLRAEGVESQFLACQPGIFELLHARGVSAVYTEAVWAAELRRARRAAKVAVREFLSAEVDWPPFVSKRQTERCVAALRGVVKLEFPVAYQAIANARNAVECLGPRVLVVGNDLTMEGRAGCLVGQRKGIKTVVMMHGSVSGSPLQRRHIADRCLAYGENSRRVLREQGLDEDKVVVCGAPYLDQVPRQTGQTHPALQNHLGLLPGQPWILVATSGPGHTVSPRHHAQLIEHLRMLSAAVKDVPIVVKLHPKDQPWYYEQAEAKIPAGRLHVVPKGAAGLPTDIFDWLQGCSLLLTGASAVAVEAMLMDVPVISMDFCGEINNVDFIDAGATMHVTSRQDLEAQVTAGLGSAERLAGVRAAADEFVRGAFNALDGQSSQRAAAVIAGLAEHGQATDGDKPIG